MQGVVKTETLYTYDAAIKKYEAERHHTWLCNQKKLEAIRQEQNEKRRYYCNQKLLGLFAVIISSFLLMVTGEAITIAGMMLGLYVMATKRMLIYNDYYKSHYRS